MVKGGGEGGIRVYDLILWPSSLFYYKLVNRSFKLSYAKGHLALTILKFKLCSNTIK